MNNLEVGRIYKVVQVRDIEHPCKIHDLVRVVEVKESEIEATIDTKTAYEGAIIVYEPQQCRNYSCAFIGKCKPEGLKDGDKCKILEIKNKLGGSCSLGKNLTLVKLLRI